MWTNKKNSSYVKVWIDFQVLTIVCSYRNMIGILAKISYSHHERKENIRSFFCSKIMICLTKNVNKQGFNLHSIFRCQVLMCDCPSLLTVAAARRTGGGVGGTGLRAELSSCSSAYSVE